MEIQTWLVVVGDPQDGFTHYGPFTDHDTALRYAEQSKDSWWVIPLLPPMLDAGVFSGDSATANEAAA